MKVYYQVKSNGLTRQKESSVGKKKKYRVVRSATVFKDSKIPCNICSSAASRRTEKYTHVSSKIITG